MWEKKELVKYLLKLALTGLVMAVLLCALLIGVAVMMHGPAGIYTYQGSVYGISKSEDVKSGYLEVSLDGTTEMVNGCNMSTSNCNGYPERGKFDFPSDQVLGKLQIGTSVSIKCQVFAPDFRKGLQFIPLDECDLMK